MKLLLNLETQLISGGLRSPQFFAIDRSRGFVEPGEALSPISAVTEAVGLARTLAIVSGAFATAVPIAGFVTPNWMTGEPIRGFPTVDASPTVDIPRDDSAPADLPEISLTPSNAESSGGGGDSSAASGGASSSSNDGDSAGDGGGSGGW